MCVRGRKKREERDKEIETLRKRDRAKKKKE